MKALLSIGEAARRLGLSVDTVRELERTGELKAVRTQGGHRRFKPDVLDAYLAQRSNPTRGRPQAPSLAPQQPARRRQRAKARDEEPDRQPDEAWDPESFEPPPTRPTAPAPKSAHEQLMEQLNQTLERRAEENRLGSLKFHGRSLIPYSASAGARSAVIEALDGYVTASRFPASASAWEARQAIEAKVAAIMEPFNAAAAHVAAQKAKAEAKRDEAERAERRVGSLIEHGKSRASLRTLGWGFEDEKEARAAVQEALDDEVEGDWSERDVDEVVDEVLDEWDEESDD